MSNLCTECDKLLKESKTLPPTCVACNVKAHKSYHLQKFDKGKLQWHLLPMELPEAVIEVLEYGKQKYGKENGWMTVPNANERYLDACMRHLALVLKGEVFDEESGLPHYSHAACNLAFLLYFLRNQHNGATKSTEEKTKIHGEIMPNV